MRKKVPENFENYEEFLQFIEKHKEHCDTRTAVCYFALGWFGYITGTTADYITRAWQDGYIEFK